MGRFALDLDLMIWNALKWPPDLLLRGERRWMLGQEGVRSFWTVLN